MVNSTGIQGLVGTYWSVITFGAFTKSSAIAVSLFYVEDSKVVRIIPSFFCAIERFLIIEIRDYA